MKRFYIFLITLMLVFGISVSAHATLIDMGDGTIYDDDLQLSWLQNANTNGWMTWSAANTWADSLAFAGFENWRLPTAIDVGGGGPTSFGGSSEFTTLFAYGIRVPAPALNDQTGNPEPF